MGKTPKIQVWKQIIKTILKVKSMEKIENEFEIASTQTLKEKNRENSKKWWNSTVLLNSALWSLSLHHDLDGHDDQ